MGFFGVGPYLGLREEKNEVLSSERGLGSGIFEFKGTSLCLFVFSVYLFYYAFFGSYNGDNLAAYISLFKNQRLAHVSTIDFTILSLAVRFMTFKIHFNVADISLPCISKRCGTR